jgi:hypothetical protein
LFRTVKERHSNRCLFRAHSTYRDPRPMCFNHANLCSALTSSIKIHNKLLAYFFRRFRLRIFLAILDCTVDNGNNKVFNRWALRLTPVDLGKYWESSQLYWHLLFYHFVRYWQACWSYSSLTSHLDDYGNDY